MDKMWILMVFSEKKYPKYSRVSHKKYRCHRATADAVEAAGGSCRAAYRIVLTVRLHK